MSPPCSETSIKNGLKIKVLHVVLFAFLKIPGSERGTVSGANVETNLALLCATHKQANTDPSLSELGQSFQSNDKMNAGVCTTCQLDPLESRNLSV